MLYIAMRSRSEVQSLHMGLYSTSIDLGFCSWFLLLGFVLGFSYVSFSIRDIKGDGKSSGQG